jgi:hypothetical protein
MLRWIRNIALSVALIVVLLGVAGLCYQEIEQRADARRFP